MSVNLTDVEAAVLLTFVKLDTDDPGGAWAAYYADVIKAANNDLDLANATCRNLRQRKLLKGEGRGMHASYYPTDKGKAAA